MNEAQLGEKIHNFRENLSQEIWEKLSLAKIKNKIF